MNKLIEDLIQIFRDYHEEVNRHEWIMEGVSGEERFRCLEKILEKQRQHYQENKEKIRGINSRIQILISKNELKKENFT